MSEVYLPLPVEIVAKILNYLDLASKEHFVSVFPHYYSLIEEEKRKYLEDNFQINYRKLVKYGINACVNYNIICVKSIMRKKKFFIDCFPESLTRFFINYNTPLIPYKCKFRSRQSGIFDCKPEDL